MIQKVSMENKIIFVMLSIQNSRDKNAGCQEMNWFVLDET